MKKNFKKGDGLATVIITIVLIALVLVIVPSIKAIQKSNSSNAEKTANAGQNIVSEAVTMSEEMGYDKVK